MKTSKAMGTQASVSVRDIGGIDETFVEFAPGVNVLEGRNATNRTSLLRSIMAALGSNDVAPKGDANEGTVELAIGDQTYSRALTRNGPTVTTSGNPYLDDPELADLFAFLLENNEARQSVARGDDLHDLIMRPVDTEEIEQAIEETMDHRESLDETLDKIESKKNRLPDLTSQKAEIQEGIAATREERDSIQAEIDELDAGLEEMEAQRDEFADRFTELSEKREEFEETTRRLDSEREQYETLKSERESLRDEREEIPTSMQEISNLGQRIGRLQERKRTIGSLLDRLQSIIQFNQDVVGDTGSELREALENEEANLTDQLVADKTLNCWTCGSEVEPKDIEETLDRLRDLQQEKMAERKEIVSELDDLRKRKRELSEHQQRREQLEQQLERIDDRIDRRSDRIDELQTTRVELQEEVMELERAVAEAEDENDTDDRILTLNKRKNELDLTLKSLQADLSEIQTEITEIEREVDRIDDLETERESVQSKLTNLRNRITDLEAAAVEAFNEHMENLLDRLGYDNLERIWIERRETEIQEGRRKVAKSKFDLHVVRTTSDNVAYEDTVDHLSESEREVTGLVFALAGYLVHEVYEVVPFMLLDSLEAIDSARIADLIAYFEEYADYLIVALLPEDAQAVDENYHYITEI